MFGGSKPPFGTGTTSTGFGGFNTATTSSPFGQPAFGKPATTGFGAAPAFGTQQNTSLFGTTAGQQQSTTNLFGTTTNASAFGAATPGQPGFGSFSQPQQNSSLFGGNQATTTPSLFGQTGTSAFGSAVKQPSLGGFGQPAAQQTSLFGQTAPQTSTNSFGGFGQTPATTTNVFGSTGSSAFGQPASNVSNPGTGIAKYNPIVGTETLMKNGQQNNVNTRHHCITAMKEYESKSLEELRMEDYLANRKGGTTQASGFFGTSSQPAASTGLFGQTAQPTTGLFSQSGANTTDNKGLFGSTAFGQNQNTGFGMGTQQSNFGIKPFGATSTPGFGATDNSNTLFGNKPTFGTTGTPSLFGTTQPTSTAPTAFGQGQSSFGGFGTTAGQTQQPLFGPNATDANKTGFGLGGTSTSNTSFGGFGTTQTSTASGGLFDQKTNANTGFGGFGNASTGLFNSSLNKVPTTGFGGFGTTQTSVAPINFNTSNNQSSLFGNTSAKPTGLFGSTPLGGNTNPAGGGLFGNTSNQSGGFGSSLGSSSLLMGGGSLQPTLGVALQQPVIPIHSHIISKVNFPYGDSEAFKDLKRTDDPTRATNPEAQKAIIDSTTAQFKINTRKSPGVLAVKPVGNNIIKKSLFEGLEESDSTVESFILKPNAKRLIIKPKSNNTTPSQSVLREQTNAEIVPTVFDSSQSNNLYTNDVPEQLNANTNSSPGISSVPLSTANKENDASRRESWLHPNNLEKVRQHNLNSGNENNSPLNSTLTELVPRKPLDTYRGQISGSTRLSVSAIPENPFEDQTSVSNATRRETILSNENAEDSLFGNRSYGADEGSLVEEPHIEYEEHPTGIKLTRIGYYTVPSLDDLKSYLAEDGSCIVPNFTIGRTGYGNVYFPKEMDVANLNIDEIVHFRNKEITVYPDDENKPAIGSGLNREAQVTLDKVWPLDKTKQEPINDPVRLVEIDWEGRLRRVCDKNETRFVEYRPETGSWVFRVKHFSKYGLNDSDEEDVTQVDPKKAKLSKDAAIKNTEHAAITNSDKSKIAVSGLENASGALDDSAEFMLMDKTKFFQQQTANNISMFDHKRYALSPSAILAKATGTDPHKLQLMKASFFMDDETQSVASDLGHDHDLNRNDRPLIYDGSNEHYWLDNLQANRIPSEASSHIDCPLVPASSSGSMLSRAAKSDIATFVDNDVVCKMPPFIIAPKVAMIKADISQIPFAESIAYSLANKCIADLSLMNSRMFRFNFGPGNSFIVPISKNALVKNELKNENFLEACPKIFRTRRKNDYSPIILQQIRLSTIQYYENFEESIIGHLRIQLENTVLEKVEGSECPYLYASNGIELIEKHKNEALKHQDFGKLEEYAASLWNLCSVLWGFHEELEDSDPTSHYAVMFRRKLMSEWLENTVTQKDLLTKSISNNMYLDHMIDLIMCHKINEACELAFNYKDQNLSLLLAQIGTGARLSRIVEHKLSNSCKDGTDTFVHINRLKIMMFVSGVSLMCSGHGPINLMEDLDWIQAFAIQLWYFSSTTMSITDSLIAYCKSFEAEEFSSKPPTPPYFNEYSAKQHGRSIYDTRFHLLKLFSRRSHSLECLLNPSTHTPDILDYRLSWLLLETLKALGYTHCSELSEAQIHVGFAAQLETYGFWEWAIFVLLHIKQQNQREIAVQNILYRYVTITKDTSLTEKEIFIVEHFGIPEKWIDYAKAVKAGSRQNHHLQAKYLLKAKQWNLAHDLIFHHIAPDAIINDNLNYLKGLLSQFESLDLTKTVKVSNWSNQGQIFLDFIDMKEKFNNLRNLKNKDDIETHWENIKPCLSELCSRINLLPCPTAKHRLCQSEIAQNLAALVRGVLIMCPDLDPCLIIKLAIDRLPLPQEFAQQELRALLDMLVMKLVTQTEVKN